MPLLGLGETLEPLLGIEEGPVVVPLGCGETFVPLLGLGGTFVPLLPIDERVVKLPLLDGRLEPALG